MSGSSVTEKHGPAGRSVEELLADASALAIERAARRVRGRLHNDRWLAKTNMYVPQAPAQLKAQFQPAKGKPKAPTVYQPGTLEAMHLGEYVAASTVLHCVDGWSYLGRALAAQLRGDSSTARHLGYYAELRAAMSLLARQGVGVFAGPHVIVKESNEVEIFRQDPTHPFAWNVLSAWASTRPSVDLLGSVIKPGGAPLVDWLSPLAGATVWEETGRNYLRLWGLDVERFGRDREARNESSYQPRTTFGAEPPSSSRAAEFSAELWRLFEPRGTTGFDWLDRYLLRRTLRKFFEDQHERSPDEEPAAFERFLEPVVGSLQLTESVRSIRSFLRRESFPDEPMLFDEAETDSGIDAAEDHLQVIARAALLLRVASGSAQQLLAEANLPYRRFEWWSRQIAGTRALAAEAAPSLSTPELLWLDVDAAIEGLEEKVSEGRAASYLGLSEECSGELAVMGGCERIALWALAA